jgi:DNA segregation ATPase FtsK/SpoIIIE, S-DNA-T family
MRTMRLISSPLSGVPDAAREFLGRRAKDLAGIGLIACSAATAMALVTWSVADPSINHATSGPIHNLLGYPGAVVSDMLMQLIGLASAAALLPPFLWGARLLRQRYLAAPFARVVLWIVGSSAAAGFLSAWPPSAHWPLPTGLGGVAGDGLLGLFSTLSLARGVGRLLVVAGLAAVAILALSACVSAGARGSEPDPDEAEPMPARARAASRARAEEQEDLDAEPGIALLSAGALAHAFLSTKGALSRRLRGAPPPMRMPVSLGSEDEPSLSATSEKPSTSPKANREGAGRIQIHNLRTPTTATSSTRAAAGLLAQAPGAMQPGAKLAADMLMRKASLMTRARRLARAMTGTPDPEATGSSTHRLDLKGRIEPELPMADGDDDDEAELEASAGSSKEAEPAPRKRVASSAAPPKAGKRLAKEAQPKLFDSFNYQLPPLALLSEPRRHSGPVMTEDALEQNARLLEGVLEDFGVRGEIMNVRPGPVVTLYELEPAPGTKSSRVISLADDVARSMSAVSARVAVVSGRNAIGIELPNQRRETVYLRELLASSDFESSKYRLPFCLGKTIGGEPVIAELARMPHLLIAGTTGSGKSVAINTMILSLLYRLTPRECRLIMVDPKMLELSVYDGIPHLLTPVVTDPKKAVVALKWAVREMEERYKKMSKLGVRNIDGYNARIAEAKAKDEVISRTVQTGFDRETGEAVYEQEVMELESLPFIAGKDIEGAVQRLAQMARAAGIHVVLATQRPSVDVITGTIKANFPTRISFQVTSKIDSRTILGEQGAEQLLGQGDMLFMAGGGRIARVHGPFVSDAEVEKVVAHLKSQGRPEYLADVLVEDAEETRGEEDDGAVFDQGAFGAPSGDLYDQAVAVVLRDKKASTSYIQRRLQIGYNRAASLMERMEKEGIVGAANHAGKREILAESVGAGRDEDMEEEDEE